MQLLRGPATVQMQPAQSGFGAATLLTLWAVAVTAALASVLVHLLFRRIEGGSVRSRRSSSSRSSSGGKGKTDKRASVTVVSSEASTGSPQGVSSDGSSSDLRIDADCPPPPAAIVTRTLQRKSISRGGSCSPVSPTSPGSARKRLSIMSPSNSMGDVLAAMARTPSRAGRRASLMSSECADNSYGDLLEMSQTGFSMEDARQHAEEAKSIRANQTPEEVLHDLQKGNARFWTGNASRPEATAFERRALLKTQFPSVAVLGCSDSRVPVEIIFDQGLGDMFVIRVAGNCLDTSTMASLQYAILHLHVKVAVVMGHEGCGAVKAAQLPSEKIEAEPAELAKVLGGMKAHLDEDRLKWAQDLRAHDREAVVTNVKHQVEALTKDLNVMGAVDKHELCIVGAFYEISSGIVDFFHEVSGDKTSDKPGSGIQSRLDPATGKLTTA